MGASQASQAARRERFSSAAAEEEMMETEDVGDGAAAAGAKSKGERASERASSEPRRVKTPPIVRTLCALRTSIRLRASRRIRSYVEESFRRFVNRFRRSHTKPILRSMRHALACPAFLSHLKGESRPLTDRQVARPKPPIKRLLRPPPVGRSVGAATYRIKAGRPEGWVNLRAAIKST